MKAIVQHSARPVDDLQSLVEVDLPDPIPGDLDLLVEIEAVSINPADVRVRMRKTDDGTASILGYDAAGRVRAVGNAVTGFSPGDRVWYAGDISRPGTNADLHLVDHRIAAVRPASLTPTEAAAMPLTLLTAWELLFDKMGFAPDQPRPGERVLIVNGAGGAGSIMIQIARLVPDLTVIATASRPETKAWCETMGAHHVINHREDMADAISALGFESVDHIILLCASDTHFPTAARIIAPFGAIGCIVPFDNPPDLNLIMRKSVSFHWEFMFARPAMSGAAPVRQGKILGLASDLVQSGRLRSTLTRTLSPLSGATLRTAHKLIESGQTIGKIAITANSEIRSTTMTNLKTIQAFLGHVFTGEMDKALALVSDEAIFISVSPVASDANPMLGTFHGKTGAQAFFTAFGDVLEPGEFETSDAFADGRHVAMYGHFKHTVRVTGKPYPSDWAMIAKVEDGLLTYYHFY
jgi:zinc-binding alcohol dehydrogenase family protein